MLRLLLPLLVLLPSLSLAQVIKGKVKNEKNEPIPFANVILLKKQDRAILKGSLTDAEGNFEILESKEKDLIILQVKSLGHQVYESEPFLLKERQLAFDVLLKEDLKQLDEVVVQAQGKVMEQSLGVLKYNLAEAKKIHAVNSTWEMLGRIPGVSTDDMENSIKVNGKNSIQFEIDGRIQRVSSGEIANFLKSLAVDDVEEIKVHTSPSAKYESNVDVVIEIKTKKKRENGWTGTETLNYWQGIYPRLNNGLYLDGKQGNFYLKGRLSIYGTKKYQLLQSSRFHKDKLEESNRADWYYGWYGVSPSVDLGWDISEKDFIGFAYQNSSEKYLEESYTDDIYLKSEQEYYRLHSPKDLNQETFKHLFNVNYKREFVTLDARLSLGADLILKDFKGEQIMHSDSIKTQENSHEILVDRLDSEIESKTNVQTYYLDYEMPVASLLDDFKIGLKYSKQKLLNEAQYRFVNSSARNEANTFDYEESTFAFYTSFSKKIGDLAMGTGLRIEKYQREANVKSVDSTFWNYLPNLSLTYNPNDNHSFSCTWSKKTTRPYHNYLNPFKNYFNINRYSVGNPTLLPVFRNNFELNYIFKGAYSLTLYHSIVNNSQTQISILDPVSRKFSRWERINLIEQIETGLNLNVPVTLKKDFLKSTLDFNLYQISGNNEYLGTAVNTKNTAWDLGIQNNFTLPSKINLELNASIASPFKEYNFEINEYIYGLDIQIKRSILKDKGDLVLGLRDIFNTRNYKISTHQGEGSRIDYENIRESRVFSLSFTYRFGKDKLKVQNKMNKGNQEERNRL